MTDTAIPPLYRSVSASKLTEKLADSLTAIKDADGLTDREVGHFLGKGTDAGKSYRTGYAEMGFVAFIRGCERWNGRFANDVLSEVGMKLVPLSARPQSDRKFGVILSRLKLAVDEALENDDEIDEVELDAMRALLDEVGQAIDARRAHTLRVVGK